MRRAQPTPATHRPPTQLDDLRGCGVGHVVVLILIDVEGFWNYDQRESLLSHSQDEDLPP